MLVTGGFQEQADDQPAALALKPRHGARGAPGLYRELEESVTSTHLVSSTSIAKVWFLQSTYSVLSSTRRDALAANYHLRACSGQAIGMIWKANLEAGNQ